MATASCKAWPTPFTWMAGASGVHQAMCCTTHQSPQAVAERRLWPGSRAGSQGVHLTHRVFNGRQVGRRHFTEVLADARLVYGAQLMTQGDR